ncbi:MAG: metallophosphoesterase [Spirochaetes bacterium]|nr:metallophosphoesterase [Spirochaetota bacterium]
MRSVTGRARGTFMANSHTLLLFLLVPTVVLAGVHYFFYRRLVKAMAFKPRTRRILTGVLVGLWLSLPAGMILGRFLGHPWRYLVAWPGFMWMGMMVVILTLLLAIDLGRLARFVYRRFSPATVPANPERRLFLTRAMGAGVLATTVLATGGAMGAALRTPGVRRVRVVLPNLPPGLDGLVIAQFTDLHVGEIVTRPFVEAVTRRINDLKPDLIVFTGDLVDGSVPRLAPHTEPLGGLRSRFGTFFVSGNHDYYSGIGPWTREVERLGMRVLHNERVTLGTGADLLDLAGVDDSGTGRSRYPDGHGADVAKALARPVPGRPVILLAHQPKEIHAAAKHGASLVLSGHTHGGQIWPFRHLVGFAQPCIDGLHLHRGKTWIYVSRGTGFWGPPLRLFTPSEITRIELRRSGEPEVGWA